jgi:hypothetical protein
MKKILTFTCLFALSVLSAQTPEGFGTGDETRLNKTEADYYKDQFKDLDQDLKFDTKKILFVKNKEIIIISKKEFFDISFKQENNKLTMISLSADEHKNSGGYDYIFLTPAGGLNQRQKDKIFRLAREKTEQIKK